MVQKVLMMLRIGKVKQNKGFTLIEILLTITILSIVMAVSVPNLMRGLTTMHIRQACDQILNDVRYAQAMAIAHQDIYTITFDAVAHNYQVTHVTSQGSLKKLKHIPSSIDMDSDVISIQCYPDGQIDKITLKLSDGKQTRILSTAYQRGVMIVIDESENAQ